MAIDFSKYLSAEQLETLKYQRKQQLAAEAWGHEQNRLLAESAGDENAVAQAVEALAIIESAIAIAEQ